MSQHVAGRTRQPVFRVLRIREYQRTRDRDRMLIGLENEFQRRQTATGQTHDLLRIVQGRADARVFRSSDGHRPRAQLNTHEGDEHRREKGGP
jgi:hypothetical protein